MLEKRRFGGLVENDKGLSKYKPVITKQSWGVKYSTGNVGNNIVITVCGARWVLEILGGGRNL